MKFKFIFLILVGVFSTMVLSIPQLAKVYNEENIDYDREYTQEYLRLHNYFSDLEFKEIDKCGEEFTLSSENYYTDFRGFNIDGYLFVFDLVYFNHFEKSSKFRINGVPTVKLFSPNVLEENRQNSFNIDGNYIVKLNYLDYNKAIFLIECGTSECNQDCFNSLYCGNGVCENGENCVRDNCCDGKTTDLTTINNCGKCGNSCEGDKLCYKQECSDCGNGVCESYENGKKCPLDCYSCGDGKCDSKETFTTCPLDCESMFVCGDDVCEERENCCLDCGCKKGQECLENLCVPILGCKSNSDCGLNQLCINKECVQNSEKEGGKNETNSNGVVIVKENKISIFFKKIISWFLNFFK